MPPTMPPPTRSIPALAWDEGGIYVMLARRMADERGLNLTLSAAEAIRTIVADAAHDLHSPSIDKSDADANYERLVNALLDADVEDGDATPQALIRHVRRLLCPCPPWIREPCPK